MQDGDINLKVEDEISVAYSSACGGIMNNENNSTNSFVISDGIGQIVEPTAVASISAASSSAEGPSTGPSPNPSDYANQVNGDSGDNRLNAIAAGSWLDLL